MKLRTKEDIEFHSDGYGRPGIPMVNVKVYDSLDNGYRKWRESYPDIDPEFTVEWIEKYVSQESLGHMWEWACESGWEEFQDRACEIYGHDMIHDRSGRHYRYRVYSTGRSGGWAYIDGINHDVDSWDAIEFSKWKRFAEFARACADDVMWRVVDMCHDRFIERQEEERDRLLNQEPTDIAEYIRESMPIGWPRSVKPGYF